MGLTLATTTLSESPAANAIDAMDGNWVFVSIVGTIGILIFFAILGKISKTSEREKTKREVAAYIAEGSMTPEEGERILNSGMDKGCKG